MPHLLPLCTRLCVLAVVLAAAAAPAARAQSFDPGERDWLLPSEVAPSSERIRAISAEAGVGAPCPTCGDRVAYRSFQGHDYELTRFSGRHVDLLLSDLWLSRFSSLEILGMVDAGDRTYELLRGIVQREPGGQGRLPVALVESTCGAACGFIGHRGVEIDDDLFDDGEVDEWWINQFRATSALSVPHNVLIHELAHNFDVYAGYIHYHEDPFHFWTDVVNIYGYVYGLFETEVPVGFGPIDRLQWHERELSWLETTMGPYRAYPGHSWSACVETQGCGDDVRAKEARAALALAVFRQAGPQALPGAMKYLHQWVSTHPTPPANAAAKEELWLEALAAGAGADITGCLGPYQWHNSPSLASRLATHGPPAAFCQDADADGVIGLLGDCNDADPAVGPGRPELPNGVDDDCNGLVDEAVASPSALSNRFNNPTPVPAPPVALDLSLGQADAFLRFQSTPPGRLLARACSPADGFRGWFGFASGATSFWRYHFDGACTYSAFEGPGKPPWTLSLEPRTGNPGVARVEVAPAPWPGPWGSVGILQKLGGGYELSATIVDASAFRQPADRVLFQVSGYGQVATVPLGGGATAAFAWPADPAPGPHSVYAQPYAGEVPAGPPLRTAFDPSLLAPCEPGPETACLLGGRFEVRGTMRDFESPPNTLPVRVMEFPGGRAESAQAAFFESFQPGNFEIGVKMVDGCALPDDSPLHSYWLFVGGLTSADSLVRVEDTATGAVFEWHNPPGNLPTTFGETGVFACGGTPVPGACVAGDETACLLGRFRVSGTMRDFESPPNTLPVRVMSFPGSRAESDQAAFFESFQPGNFEIGVKMVDACALPPGSPGRAYWLFAGGLTSARTDLTIRQVATGQVIDWVNPSGSLPTSTGDTAAFACP